MYSYESVISDVNSTFIYMYLYNNSYESVVFQTLLYMYSYESVIPDVNNTFIYMYLYNNSYESVIPDVNNHITTIVMKVSHY